MDSPAHRGNSVDLSVHDILLRDSTREVEVIELHEALDKHFVKFTAFKSLA